MSIRVHPWFTLVLLSGATTSPLRAAEEQEDGKLPDLVVEASRASTSVIPRDFPGSATVITGEELENSGARSIADVLATRAGIRLTSTTGNTADGAVHLRGFGENSSSRVLILVDGRPVNRPDMAGVSLMEVPLARLERVEVLRGSQTARFGDNAVGGVINLVTKAPGEKLEGAIEGAGGSDGYFLGRLSTTGRVDGHGLALDLERNYTDGWRENSTSETDSASLRWDRRILPAAEIRAGFSWTDDYSEFPGPLTRSRYEDDPRQSVYADSPFADQYFSEQTTLAADATLLAGTTGPFRFEAPVAWLQRDQSWNMGPGSHTDNLLETITFGPVLRWELDRLAIETGLNLRHDSLDLDQYAEIRRRNRSGEAELTREIGGVFAAADWEPWQHWHFTGAARWEHSRVKAEAANFNDPENPELNFSRDGAETNHAFQAGVRWQPDEEKSAWLRYDRLYRLPSTDELASYQGYPLSVPFNDRLTAETGHNLELGGEFLPGPWSFRLNGFAQWLEGEIAYDYLRNINVNFADTRRIGLETGAGYRTAFLEADLRYTWLKAEYDDGDYAGKEVYLVPRHEAAGVVAIHPWKSVTCQAEYVYTGSSFEGNDFANNAEKLPAHGITNLLLRYEPRPGLSLYLRVNNLLDEGYATVKYSGVWYPAAGRQYIVGLRREF